MAQTRNGRNTAASAAQTAAEPFATLARVPPTSRSRARAQASATDIATAIAVGAVMVAAAAAVGGSGLVAAHMAAATRTRGLGQHGVGGFEPTWLRHQMGSAAPDGVDTYMQARGPQETIRTVPGIKSDLIRSRLYDL